MAKKNLKNYILVLFTLLGIFLCFSVVFADGWVNDGYGNWLYEENGKFVKNDTRVIDGVTYYFNHAGYWLPREANNDVKLKSKEKVSFVIEGMDDSNRKYKTQVNVVMPVVEGKNADVINEFIKKEFQNVITKYLLDYRKSILFLTPKMDLDEMLEASNLRGIICFGYFGGGTFNVYLDTKKLEMWAMPNQM